MRTDRLRVNSFSLKKVLYQVWKLWWTYCNLEYSHQPRNDDSQSIIYVSIRHESRFRIGVSPTVKKQTYPKDISSNDSQDNLDNYDASVKLIPLNFATNPILIKRDLSQGCPLPYTCWRMCRSIIEKLSSEEFGRYGYILSNKDWVTLQAMQAIFFYSQKIIKEWSNY
jgi:hypothetical protein